MRNDFFEEVMREGDDPDGEDPNKDLKLLFSKPFQEHNLGYFAQRNLSLS